MFSAKRLDVFCFINEETFSLPLNSMKQLRGKILSVLWQEITRRTLITCKYKFDRFEQADARFSQRQRDSVISIFPRKQTKLLKISEKLW